MERDLRVPIIVVSIAIPLAVAVILLVPGIRIDFGFDTHALPLFHAILNSMTAVLLLFSLYFIRRKKIKVHKTLNLIAIGLSTIFLISYVIYHSSNPSTRYGDLNHDGILSDSEKLQAGFMRWIYYVVLSSHILLSGAIVPLVLVTLQRALQEKFDKHRRIAKITWPIWFYVAVSGVVVYFMIRPYY